MRQPLSVLSAVILLTACGGGGNSSGPSSVVGVTLVSASPPPGSTLTLTPGARGGLSAQIAMIFSVVSDRDLASSLGTVYWEEGGKSCGFSSGVAVGKVKANQPMTLMVHTVEWFGCPLPTTTSTISVEVRELSLCFDGCGATPSFSRDLPISYTFVASTPSGGQ